MQHFLDFEKPIAELEGMIEMLRHRTAGDGVNTSEEIAKLQAKVERLFRQIYAKLTPWQKVQVARHPQRPHFSNYLAELVTEWTPLAGDRLFGEDPAILGGLGRFRGRSVVVIGHEKGSDTDSRVRHNFGMARPEGYRKAQRLFQMADHFQLPVLTFVDTPGAYPGVDAEERGQAEAIARCVEAGLRLRVPFVSVVIGEGGSGGAIAIAAADTVLMLEHAIYSVISPEGCASILWRDGEEAKQASEALKLTAQDLLTLGLIDRIINEPLGGAHRQQRQVVNAVGNALDKELTRLAKLEGGVLRAHRREKFLEMGKKGLG
ncbi:MAG: acetyl-CoA carboxylase carboxyltransferase subunit alpha [Alphaproteobacteria bacterium]|nr:acetyl-CoA carboxylase carboxyltransferase subunit alpha [Alphaproteobacteria bacterium]